MKWGIEKEMKTACEGVGGRLQVKGCVCRKDRCGRPSRDYQGETWTTWEWDMKGEAMQNAICLVIATDVLSSTSM